MWRSGSLEIPAVLEMLNNLETEEISLEMSAPNRAGILTPLNNENKDEDTL